MKKGILLTFCFFLMVLQVKTQYDNSASISATVLSKVNVKRYSDFPVLEIFNHQDPNFGFKVDSSLMTQDVNSLFLLVEQLRGLEKNSQKTSTYLTSEVLFDTTISLLLLQAYSAPKELLLNAFRISQQVSFDQSKMKRVGELLIKINASTNGEDVLRPRGTEASNPKNVGSNSPLPPPPPMPSRESAQSLVIVNKSSKNLYVYLDQAYKGIAYPGKSFQIQAKPGCSEVLAESLDQFRSAKKYCFGVEKSNQWLISN